MEAAMRNFFLFLSKNKWFTNVAKKYGLRFGAARFVAGETIEQAIHRINDLNKKGLSVTIDYLGEFVDDEKEANVMADHAVQAIEAISRHQLDAQFSLN